MTEVPTLGERKEVLEEFCKQQMAAFWSLRSIQFLDDLPKNPTGKILRRELRALSA